MTCRASLIALFACACLSVQVAGARQTSETSTDGDAVLGEWYTPGDRSVIEIERRGDLYYGRIIWLRDEEETGEVHLDINNPDESLQDRRIVGLEILRDFRYDGAGRYVGGRIYDPESGRTYRSRMTLRDAETLDVRGFVGISLLGRTETFRRTAGSGR